MQTKKLSFCINNLITNIFTNTLVINIFLTTIATQLLKSHLTSASKHSQDVCKIAVEPFMN